MQEDSHDDLMMSPGAVAGAPSPGATGHDERDEPQAAASVARDAPTRPAIERRGDRRQGRPHRMEADGPGGRPGPGSRIPQSETGLRRASIRRMVASSLLSGRPRTLLLRRRS